MRRFAIIVLNWNSASDTIHCATSLLNQTNELPDVILVDNASSDNSVKKLTAFSKNHKDRVIFIRNDKNVGFAGGINTGISYALEKNYTFIGTLNPDATADALWSHCLLGELTSHPDTGIATGILARQDKKHIDTTGEQFPIWGIPGPRGRDGLLINAPKKSEYIFGATGGGFIARADVFKTVGLFDETFFMYFEDVDLCFRAQLAGYKVRYTPKSIAYHKLSVSTNKVPGLAVHNTFKNLPLLFIKNTPSRLLPLMLPRFFIAYTLIFGHALFGDSRAAAIKGTLRSWRLLPHALRKRHAIQRNRVVSASYINKILLHDIPPEQVGLRKFRRLFTGK